MQNQILPGGDANLPGRPAATTAPPVPEVEATVSQPLESRHAAEFIHRKIADRASANRDDTRDARAMALITDHELFMQRLIDSGVSMAEVLAAWHDYYSGLPDSEKNKIWAEFRNVNTLTRAYRLSGQYHPGLVTGASIQPAITVPAPVPGTGMPQLVAATASISRLAEAGQAAVQQNPATGQQMEPGVQVSAAALQPQAAEQPGASVNSLGGRALNAQPAENIAQVIAGEGTQDTVAPVHGGHFLSSLGFGIASALAVVVVCMFSFFNEVVISPFIQPSRTVTETPIFEASAGTADVSRSPKILIPKINVEIPVDYSLKTTDEQAVETALDGGIVHYPTTVRPGQAGNAAFFGHSSNNIFNPGKYKFAFAFLDRLVRRDVFYLAYEGKMYGYEVISTRVVSPTEVGVLGPVEGQTATATLITCNPPGTSINRLVVVGKQIDPDPAGNPAPAAPVPSVATAVQKKDLPGNGPTLWNRLWSSVF